MNFEQLQIFGAYIAKDYSKDIFKLLLDYQSISSSEAASRLGLHIKTVQEFFEAMTSANILMKIEVYEKKRPYFRYRLKQDFITLNLDLNELVSKNNNNNSQNLKIRERKNSSLLFNIGRHGKYLSSLGIMIGKGRDRKEKKVNLTENQGKFLYKLPFPDAEPKSVEDIMRDTDINDNFKQEILNIVEYLIENNAIDVFR